MKNILNIISVYQNLVIFGNIALQNIQAVTLLEVIIVI